MIDKQGREITYLRISVTDKCNLRCRYCMPEEGVCKKSHADMLSEDEIIMAVEAAASLGIHKIRITGGEPMVKKNIVSICRRVAATPGIEEVCLTTNGILLPQLGKELKAAGVKRINLSLDTLDPDKYAYITRIGKLEAFREGLKAALNAGFEKIKVNAVLIGGFNDDEIVNLANLTREYPVDMRFIELMPFSGQGEKEELVVTENELLGKFSYLSPCNSEDASVAKYYTAENFQGRVGFISPRSHKFCSKCNRIRLLADGRLKPCLGNDKVYDIRSFIGDKELLSQKIEEIIYNKPSSHHFEDGENFRGLNLIGG